MMARNATVPLTGRIQKRKTDHLRIVIFGLQRAAGPYRWASCGQYEDMPPAFKCPPDGSSGLTDLPVGLAVTVTPSVR